MNHITLKGRLTAAPELKNTSSNVPYCQFTVAVDRSYSSKEEKITDFFNVTAWRRTAEFIAKYFVKGQEILLCGEMQGNKYVDKDGNNRIAWNVLVNNVEFCGNKSENTSTGSHPNTTKKNVSIPYDEDDDDLPF